MIPPFHKYEIYAAIRLIREVYRGDVSGQFLKQCQEKLTRDPGFDPGYDILVDFRSCSFSMRAAEAGYSAMQHDEIFDSTAAKTALLVSSPKETALTMLVSSKVSSRIMKMFTTETAAFDWMGKDLENLPFSLEGDL